MRHGPSNRAAMAVCALATLLPFVQATTRIVTFKDPNCQTILGTINPADSVGSGPCHQIATDYDSFMVTRIGVDCGVTIYGNVEFCSSPDLQVAELGNCYNTTWAYFSVDNCAPGQETSSIPPIVFPTTLPSSSDTNGSSSQVNVGAIVGGTLAGIAVLSALAAYFCWLRPRRNQRKQRSSAPASAPAPAAPLPEHAHLVPGDVPKNDYPFVVSPLTPVPHEPVYQQAYEMSPQHILEVHEDTSVRHELPV